MVEERPGLHVTASVEVINDGDPRRLAGVPPGHHSQHLLEHRLLAGNRQRPLVGEAVLLLRLLEERLEDRVVQVRRPHDEPPAPAPHADRHVARRHVRRNPNSPIRRGGARSLLPPPVDHLSDPDNVPDLVAAPDDPLHSPARYADGKKI